MNPNNSYQNQEHFKILENTCFWTTAGANFDIHNNFVYSRSAKKLAQKMEECNGVKSTPHSMTPSDANCANGHAHACIFPPIFTRIVIAC